jgi:hypothetical protein
MNIKTKWAVILSITLTSCTKPYTIQLDNTETQVVVYSILSPDSLITINLTESVDMSKYASSKYDFKPIDNAQVFIYKNNTIIDTAIYASDGYYYGSTKPLENNSYKLQVRAEGYDEVKAEGLIPTKIKIDSIIKTEIKKDKKYEIAILFTDPPNEDNYYCIYMFGITNYYSTDDQVIGSWESTDAIRPIFTDKLFQGKQYEIKFNVHVNIYEHYSFDVNNIAIYLYSLSERYYLFLQSYNKQIPKSGDDLMEFFQQGLIEPIPIYSNIEGGLGIFAGYAISTDTVYFGNN